MSLQGAISRSLLTTRYVAGSSASLILYDHILAFDKEVNLVWGGRWTTLSVIMTVDMYVREIGLLLFAIVTSGAISFGSTHVGQFVSTFTRDETLMPLICRQKCILMLVFILIYGVLIAASVNSIILYRVYILWDDRKTVARVLIGGFAACYVATLGFAILTGIHLSPGVQYLANINACSFSRKSLYTSITWSGIVLYDLCVFVLLFVRILGSPRRQNSQLIGILYRDGLMTFMGFFALRIARLLSSILLDAEGVMIIPLITWALDGVLSRHIFLRVKQIDGAGSTAYVWQSQQKSSVLGRISTVQVWEEVEMETK